MAAFRFARAGTPLPRRTTDILLSTNNLTLFAIAIILSKFAIVKRLAEKYLTFLLLLS